MTDNIRDRCTDAKESVSIVTVSAVAVEAPFCIDAVSERATSAVVCCTFVDIYAIQYRQEHERL